VSSTKHLAPLPYLYQQEYQKEPLFGLYGNSFNIYYIVDGYVDEQCACGTLLLLHGSNVMSYVKVK